MTTHKRLEGFPAHERAYFDSGSVKASPAFVAWFDMMGAKVAFTRGLPKAANFIAKMHDALARATPRSGCDVVPITDGAFLITSSALTLRRSLELAMFRLACSFMHETKNEHRFLVRCGIAFGDVIRGRALAIGFQDQADAAPYAHQAPLGLPIGDAHSAESSAPPLGVFVHSSAASHWGLRAEGSWRWWDTGILAPAQASSLGKAVASYLGTLTWENKAKAAQQASDYFSTTAP